MANTRSRYLIYFYSPLPSSYLSFRAQGGLLLSKFKRTDMLRPSLKLILRRSVPALRPAIGTPRNISIVGSGRGQGRFKAEACPAKRAPAPVSERFASRYQFPDEQGTPPAQFDFLSLESFEKMSHNPKFWLPLPDPDIALSTAYLVLVRMIMYMGRPKVSIGRGKKQTLGGF